MRGVSRKFIEFLTGQNTHRNTDLAALLNHSSQANIFPLLGDTNPLEIAPARFKRFRNCINSVENIHEQ